jgi:hypothetical protein
MTIHLPLLYKLNLATPLKTPMKRSIDNISIASKIFIYVQKFLLAKKVSSEL